MQPGQMVYCIADDQDYFLLRASLPSCAPRKGNVYHVRTVYPNCPSCGGDHIDLEEVVAPFINGFPANWFRPCRPVNFNAFVARLFPIAGEGPEA
jgi:hypothetical protein